MSKYNIKYISILHISSLIVALSVFAVNRSYSQNFSDTVNLKEIIVFEKKLNDQTGLKTIKIDSSVLANSAGSSLDEILMKHSSISIKNYGNGAVSTSSFRGSGASHTKVLWNGVKINSPMLGQLDFSLLPAFFIDEILIYHGGVALGNNSGALAGSINMKSVADWKNKLSVDFAQIFGSFNTKKSIGSFSLGGKKFQSKTKILISNSTNNFKYQNLPFIGNEEIIQRQNSSFSQRSVVQEFYIKPNSKTLVSSAFWVQKAYREIPPKENESQKEDILRSYVEYKRFFEKSNICYRVSYIYDYMNFIDENLSIDSKNSSENFSNFIEYELNLLNYLKIHAGLSNSFYKTASTNYDRNFEQQIYSVFTGLDYELNEKQNLSLLVKHEIVDRAAIPLIFSFGYEYKILNNKDLLLKSNFSRNYHSPTLNDLYWSEFGNPNLENEEGYSGEIGLQFIDKKNKKLSFEMEFTSYASLIDNWIIWIPQNNGLWKPENLKQVYRHGFEATIGTFFKFKKFNIHINNFYLFCKSTNRKSIVANDNSLGKQLIYVPVHSFNSNLEIKYKSSFLKYSFNLEGKRYAQTDNSDNIEYFDYLPTYALSKISCGYELRRKNSIFSAQLDINNLCNKSYQMVLNYPMPLRNFSILIRYRMKKYN
ncbi:MAG: TonB-dependent receptor plug domain-containing protein [Bacteroidetes bacterium]|nr:TonB-dependent receptor plug domain-containing protein [Bacteroidota bacterium]MBT7142507.1 TonB-dependent receptor plug domain-containing protein [Bacteroidota bacterium]MBT7490727.1 TonB-dependent receptor plug domain-containing protein [Bacteroidota bacterium]